MTTVEKSERPERNQDLRCQSGPSAKDSVLFSGGDSSKNYWAEQQRLQILDLLFDKFPTPATFACWKTRFKTEVCTCSQFPTEAMQCIKEVEMVDSVDEFRSSSSIRVFQCQILKYLMRGLLQRWSRSSINLTSKEEQSGGTKGPEAGPFLSWQTDCLPDLRLLPGHWSQRFGRKLCRPIHYQSTKWRYSGIRFKVGRNSIVYDENPAWWHLGRIVQIKNTRVWETQYRFRIVWPGDSSEEVRTWLSQIENYGEKKCRARYSK